MKYLAALKTNVNNQLTAMETEQSSVNLIMREEIDWNYYENW